MSLDEQLSQLMSGEMSAHERAALEARIADEPHVAERWRQLQALILDLENLPEQPPPAHLDAAVVGTPAARRSWAPVAFAAALAAAVLLLAWPSPPTHLVPTAGSQWVEGRVQLDLHEAVVQIDGSAHIFVEPNSDLVRVGGQEVDMQRQALIGALAGATLTIAVYEGRAEVGDTELTAGESTTLTLPGAAPTIATESARPRPQRPDAATAQELTTLRTRVAELESALKVSQVTQAITSGQLAAVQGGEVPWPADLPEAWTADAWTREFEAAVALSPDAEIVEVDCSEYPCVAVLTAPGPDDPDAHGTGLGEQISKRMQEVLGKSNAMLMETVRTDDQRSEATIGLAMFSGNTEHDQDAQTRTRFRLEQLLSIAGADEL